MMRARWQALSERDRRVLGVGAVLVALLLGWSFIWHPLARSREQLAIQVAADRSALAWMRNAQQQVPGVDANSAHAQNDRQGRSLLALADASAREAGLGASLKRVEPGSARSVRVSFQAVNFDALIAWVEHLSRDYGVEASDLSADRVEGNGLVDARVTLEDR